MSNKLKLVQEGVKLALDAADAAADVTAEFNKVKTQNLELVDRVSDFIRTPGLLLFLLFSVQLAPSACHCFCISVQYLN